MTKQNQTFAAITMDQFLEMISQGQNPAEFVTMDEEAGLAAAQAVSIAQRVAKELNKPKQHEPKTYSVLQQVKTVKRRTQLLSEFFEAHNLQTMQIGGRLGITLKNGLVECEAIVDVNFDSLRVVVPAFGMDVMETVRSHAHALDLAHSYYNAFLLSTQDVSFALQTAVQGRLNQLETGIKVVRKNKEFGVPELVVYNREGRPCGTIIFHDMKIDDETITKVVYKADALAE